MRIAIIDLGTNSVRFDVVQVGADGFVDRLHREKLMIRLGEHVFKRRRLDPHSIGVCLDAFQSFARTLKNFRVRRVVAFGTSALREAKDGQKLIEKIKRTTGIIVRIISGDEEARLIAKGVLGNEQGLRGRFALVDIGGGSTEVTICSGRKILRSGSFALGTARLQQVFLKTIPPDTHPHEKGNSIDNLRRHIRGVLLYRLVSEEWPKVSRVIGSSGTIRTLSRISRRENGTEIIEKSYLDDLVRRMTKMNREQLAKIRGMEPRRVDMILGGAILLQECMNSVHARFAESTEFSLRDGILDEHIEHLKKTQDISADIVAEVFKVAKRLGLDEAELKQSVRIAETIFDALKKIHRLNLEWKAYLVMAILLDESGRSISAVNYESHSSYIADHLDLSHLGELERELLSQLCLRHRNGKSFNKKDIPFKKNPVLRRVFFKLLALLKISAALSFQRSKPIKIEKVSTKGKLIKILVSKRYAPDLQVLRAEQNKQLFEEVFKKQLSIELL